MLAVWIFLGVQVVIGAMVQMGYIDLLPWWWHTLFVVQLVAGILLGGLLGRGRGSVRTP